MSFPRVVIFSAIILFSIIIVTAVSKKKSSDKKELPVAAQMVDKDAEKKLFAQAAALPQTTVAVQPVVMEEKPAAPLALSLDDDNDFPQCDRMQKLFVPSANQLPIVETITYTSNVSWLKGRPAWVGDYASYYATSRHFIARSLNGRADYFTQKVAPGNRFNVLRKDLNIQFHLLVDLSRCKMGFYYIDVGNNERVLLKTYRVGLGKLDPKRSSGSLTPLGKFSLDNGKTAVYKAGDTGYFQDQKVEMVQVFGTRWVPFKEELEGEGTPINGLGIHGVPCRWDSNSSEFVEMGESVGSHASLGCIRLQLEDMEELFSVIVTKPTVVEIVRDFYEAKLPGIEKEASVQQKAANGS